LAWTTYTPVITATTGSITSYTINFARYAKLGKQVTVFVDYNVTNNGTGSGQQDFTLPVNARSGSLCGGAGLDGPTGKMLNGYLVSVTNARIGFYDFTYPGSGAKRMTITYEAA
jgi:hypothetical protein